MNPQFTAGARFKVANDGARGKYESDNDKNAYLANSIYNAAALIIDDMAARDKKFAPLKTGVDALSYVIKAAVDKGIHDFRAPDHGSEDHHDYFSDMRRYVEKHIKADINLVNDRTKQVLSHLGINV